MAGEAYLWSGEANEKFYPYPGTDNRSGGIGP